MMQSLDRSQKSFCESPIGNIRLLAPAGCGKTLCLLHRCLHLVEQGKPQRPRFLLVTFTRAARDELLSRINLEGHFSPLRDLVEITTLNSWGFRRIKNSAFNPQLKTSKADFHFTMLNQLQPVWREYEDVSRAIQKKKNTTPSVLMNLMDSFKSLGFDHQRHTNFAKFEEHLQALHAQGLTRKLQGHFQELAKLGVLDTKVTEGGEEVPQAEALQVYEAFFKFWRAASDQLMKSDTFTLEDQKYVAYLDERQKMGDGSYLSGAASYNHVIVDEFQDINPLDLALVRAIGERNKATITIAGDDDQAIFEWRGSTPHYILNPDKCFGRDFHTHILGVNYRSPQNIVHHSQKLIVHNQRRVAKKIEAAGNEQAQIQIEATDNLVASLEYVHRIFEESVKQGASPSRVAIIGRKRSQLIPYQVYFASKDISFCAAEDLQVFLSDTFDRLLELLNVKTRTENGHTLSRSQIIKDLLTLCDLVKRYPLNKKDRAGLTNHLQKSDLVSFTAGISSLSEYRGQLKGSNAEGKMSLDMATSVDRFIAADSVSDALLTLSDDFKGLQIDFGKAADDIFYTDPPFSQLAEYASRYGKDYSQFVDDIERAKQQLAYTPPFDDESDGMAQVELWKRPMHLMTALRAKGKEFGTVILLDTVDGIWPHKNANTLQELEAERRVFYVAFTRARERVVMLVPKTIGGAQAIISPYIRELGFQEM